MARFIGPLQRSVNRAAAGCRGRLWYGSQDVVPEFWSADSGFQWRFRTYGSVAEIVKSPMKFNLVRIVRNQIQNFMEYAPLYQPASEIGDFEVTDRQGEQVITLTRKYGENEDIRIEASTFDCCVIVPLTGEGPSRGEERHHISLRIYITKGEGSKALEVICSSWPEFLEIQRFFVANDRQHQLVKPYVGRYYGALDCKFRQSLYKFLGERGIDNELSYLLHIYMKNRKKDGFRSLVAQGSIVRGAVKLVLHFNFYITVNSKFS